MIMACIVIAIVWTITGLNAPTLYNATHNYVNSSCNSSRLNIAGVKWKKNLVTLCKIVFFCMKQVNDLIAD